MNEMRPQLGPGGFQQSNYAAASGESRPNATPPSGALSAGAKSGCGCQDAGAGVAEAGSPPMAGMGGAAPSILPAEAISAGVTAWLNNKKFTGLWSINQVRNSWVYVDGVGWKKLANNSDSAIVALTVLGSHAREKASVVNYREESDGMIHEMYVW